VRATTGTDAGWELVFGDDEGLATAGDDTEPVAPLGPLPPDIATGLLTAEEVALPVLPVLVALDWAVDAPELPEVATGLDVTLELPPPPPPAPADPTVEPPVAACVPAASAARAGEAKSSTPTAVAATNARGERRLPEPVMPEVKRTPFMSPLV